MSDREYAVWTLAPLVDREPTITPAGNKYWALRRTASYGGMSHMVAKVVWRYTFMPDMPWEDL